MMRQARRGISMMEVMIAVFVLMVMSVIVFEVLESSIELTEIIEQRDATTRAARVALSRVRRDVELAYLTPSRQAVNTYETVFVGVNQDPDQLTFATLSHQRLYMNSREADQAEVSIWAEEGPRDKTEELILYHRESARVDEEPDEGGRIYPLAYNVQSFNLRYLDPRVNEWRDDWDTRKADTAYRLPRMVEVALVLLAEDPDDPGDFLPVPFLSTVVMVYGDPLINPMNPMGLNPVQSPLGGGSFPVPGAGQGNTLNPNSRPTGGRGGRGSTGGPTSGGPTNGGASTGGRVPFDAMFGGKPR